MPEQNPFAPPGADPNATYFQQQLAAGNANWGQGTPTTPLPSGGSSGTPPPVNLNPSTTTTSSNIQNPPTTGLDIASLLAKNVSNQDSLMQKIMGFFTPTSEEEQYQKDYLKYQQELDKNAAEQEQLVLDTGDTINKLGTQAGVTTGVASAQQFEAQRQALYKQGILGVKASSLSRAQGVALQTLQNAQSSRGQKLEAAKFLYDANRNNINDTLALYKATAPENLNVSIDKTTGFGTAIMRNPVTGEVYTKDLGKVQAPELYSKDNIFGDASGGYFSINPKTGAITQISEGSTKYQMGNDAYGNPITFNPKTGEFSNAAGMPSSSTGEAFFGLPPKVYEAARKIFDQFDGHAIVKKFNTVQEGNNFAQSINPNSANAADNQAIIYAFAKAMDPDSVVREGEYATVQKYSQSWLESFGFNAARVVNNQEFLTPQAVTNLQKTIQRKYDAVAPQYFNLRNEYARKIDSATGTKGKGNEMLEDYSRAYTNSDLDGLWNTLNPDMSGGQTSNGLNLQSFQELIKSGGLSYGGSGGTNPKAFSPTISNTLASVLTQKFPALSDGGQCGVFVRNVAKSFGLDYPRLGDSLASKTAAVQKYGTSTNNARIGSVIVTKENPTYGHVAWIIGRNANGYVVAESNFKQSNKISYGRTIPFNSGKIIGIINPKSA